MTISEKTLKFMPIAGVILLIILFSFIVYTFDPDFFRGYDQPMILFLLGMYLFFYIIDFFVERKLSPEKLVGKDFIFIVLKFLILTSYVSVRQYFIQDQHDKKSFLFHFLIYVILFMFLDILIYFHIIRKKS